MHPGNYFITGTDTDIGKTRVGAALLHALRRHGLRAIGMKPVASGCHWTPEGWRNEDALVLQAASDPHPTYALVNPIALPTPTAPTIAAEQAGMVIELPPILAAYRSLRQQADSVVVEGVGGWLAPLAESLDQSDLVRALDLDVVLVVGMRLGCLNHARLTARAIREDGCRFVGWVANTVADPMVDADEYFAALQGAIAAPCLGRIPFLPNASAGEIAAFLTAPD
jgi:dethiobiotin synthetase